MKPFPPLSFGRRRHEAGSTTFLALFMLALLLFIGATVLMNATRLYNGNEKVEGWQEALNAAEAGADLGLANLRWTVVTSPTPVPSPFASALGWSVQNTTDGGGVTNNTIYSCTTPHITQTGEGTSETWADVTVDSPIGDNTTSPPSGLTYHGNQWWRIRATGHARLPGLRRASLDILSDMNGRHDNALRKFNFLYQRKIWSPATNAWVATAGTLSVPEAIRTIEVMVQPRTSWLPAIVALDSLTIGGKQIIDSYDPTDSTKSTNGQYDSAKRQSNGNVGVGGTRNGVNITSGSSDLTSGSAEKIYGNASTNGGSFTDKNNTIQSPGTINNSVNTNIPMIPVPTWGAAGSPAINYAVTDVTSKTTITANANTALNYYKIANINSQLTIAGTGTVNIWLTTGATTSGSIIINKGASLNIYFTGGTFHPNNTNSVNNLNQDPSTFSIYGVGTGTGSGPGIDIHIGDSGGTQNFYGTVYAPYRTLNLKYDGNTNFDPNSAFYGSFIGDTINLQGSLHYDESLNGIGDSVIDYNRNSFVEDPR